MSFLDYKAKQIEPNAKHQVHHSKTENLLVNEKSNLRSGVHEKKNRIIILDNQEDLLVTCKTTLRDQVIKLLINISQLRPECFF